MNFETSFKDARLFPVYSLKELNERSKLKFPFMEVFIKAARSSSSSSDKKTRAKARRKLKDETIAALAKLSMVSEVLEVDTLEEILAALDGLAD